MRPPRARARAGPSATLAWKAAALTLAVGATASSLLSMRQRRLQAASEMASSLREAQALERQAWALRSRLAELTTPQRIDSLAKAMDVELRPIHADWCAWLDSGYEVKREVAAGARQDADGRGL